MFTVIYDDHAWGGWYRRFLEDFQSSGLCTLVHAEDDLVWGGGNGFLAGPVLYSVHYMWSSAEWLFKNSRGWPVGAYVHTVTNFPLTAGYRLDPEERKYLEAFDVLFCATESYRTFLHEQGFKNVIVVGFPIDWERISRAPHPETFNVPRTFAIAQRMHLDNNPGVVLRIAKALIDRGWAGTLYESAGVPQDVKAAAEAVGLGVVNTSTHRHFLDGLAHHEWLISATQNESFGRVFAEAMELGVKVCAPRVAGLWDLFKEDTLYPPFHVPDAVARIQDGVNAEFRPGVWEFHQANDVVRRINMHLQRTEVTR